MEEFERIGGVGAETGKNGASCGGSEEAQGHGSSTISVLKRPEEAWLNQSGLLKSYNLFFGIEKIQSHYRQLHYIEYSANPTTYSQKYGKKQLLFVFPSLPLIPSHLSVPSSPQTHSLLASIQYSAVGASGPRQYKFYSSLVHEFTIVKIKMQPSNRTLPALKYSVLKPNPVVSSVKRLFVRPHPRCPYELSTQEGLNLRKYRRVVESLDSIIQDYQWRHEQSSPVVRCLYIELQPPSAARGLALDIYIEDMECLLSAMKRLLLPEALFLIRGALRGYGAIFERFGEVSVGEQAIGLDSNGNCLVWTNQQLERNESGDCKITEPREAVADVLALVREKSEPVCEGLLGRLGELLAKEAGDFEKAIAAVEAFAKTCKTKVPPNLRYLVHQQRLTKDCEGIRTQRTICGEKQRNPFNSRKFIFSRNSLASLRVLSPRENCSFSPKGIASTLRKTTSPNSTLMAFSSNRQHLNKSVESSTAREDPKTSKIASWATDRQQLFAFPHSRSKSQANQCIQIINNIRPRRDGIAQSNGQIAEKKKASNISENARTAESFNRSKASPNSEGEERSGGLVCQQIVFSPSNKVSSFRAYKECQSYECSPFIIKEEPNTSSTNQLSESPDHKFQPIPEFFRANKWTPVIRNLMEARNNLEHSVNDGQDANHYLSEVRLQKLDCLGKYMAASLIPERSAKKGGH